MTALASDAYVALGDFESAEALRAPQINARLHRIVTELPCALFVNSALWAWNHEDYKRAYDLILTAVTTYPDDIPALVTYASLAYEQTKVPEQTDLEKTLRKTALRTKRMLAYDERPKMQVADALHRISDAIEKQRAADGVADGKLLAMRAFLTFALTPDMTPKARLAYIWHELELNEIQRNLYPPLLVQLAVHELLLQGQEEAARTLFENYLDARYVLTADDAEQTAATKKEVVQTDVFGGEKRVPPQVIPQEVLVAAFGDRAARHAHTLEVWEGETAAYFALVDKNVAAAKRLYEYVVYETGTDSRAEVASAANLAVICSSTGDKKRALELYGQAAGRSTDSVQKSTILYRSAVLQVAQGDERSAQVSLDYSLALNPANADARLLKRTLGL
jgi:tetratricopeptide (TPR) repeat protein